MARINGLDILRIPINGKETLRVMRNGVELWSGTGLPSGYTLLEYIQSSGSQYIDTGVIVSGNNARIVYDFAWTSLTDATALFGSQTTSGTPYMVAYYGGSVLKFYCGTSSGILPISGLLANDRMVLDMNMSSNTLSVSLDGSTQTASYSSTIYNNVSVFLFGNSHSGTAKQLSCHRLYACKIYDNDTLLRDFIPCMNASNVCGLFDKVNKVFYPSASSTAFSGSLPVELPSEYTLLDYIESSGSQYINTGFIPNQNTRVVAEFETEESNGDWRCVFAARSSSSNTDSVGFYLSPQNVFSGFYGGGTQFSFSSIAREGKHTVDWNKNTISLDGTANSLTAQTFSSGCSLYLCAVNNNGSVYSSHFFVGKIYSLQIFDNGTLVRDFTPCMNISGVYGLYDKVNKQFYASASSTGFTGA